MSEDMNIVNSWLCLQHYEQEVAFRMTGSYSMPVLKFWERCLSMAQKRYLAACESLTKIRKMKVPAMQFNIGEKQVNVAGNLQTGPREEVINV